MSNTSDLKINLDELRAKTNKPPETPQQIKIGKYTIQEIDDKLMISDGKVKFSVNEMYEVLINHCEALKTLINKT